MTTSSEKTKTYDNTEKIVVVKIIKFDDNERDTEYGKFLNVTVVPQTVIEQTYSESELAMLKMTGKQVEAKEDFSDSDSVARCGTTETELKEELEKFRSRVNEKKFTSCYAYIKGKVSLSEYKDGRKFINISPTIVSDLSSFMDKETILKFIKDFKKQGNLFEGVFEKKDSSTSSTSSTYANAWD